MADRAPPPSYDEAVNNKGIPQTAPVRVVVEQGFAPFPQRMVCPSCHANIETKVEYRPNSNTHLIALLLCFLFWPCALYPYCIDTCKDAMHYCPECGTFLGTYTN